MFWGVLFVFVCGGCLGGGLGFIVVTCLIVRRLGGLGLLLLLFWLIVLSCVVWLLMCFDGW